MTWGWRVAGLGFLALSVLSLTQSLRFSLTDELGPGPGFFPFWLSLLGGALALGLVVQVGKGRETIATGRPIPNRAATLRIVTIVAGLAAVALLLVPLGFRLTLLGFTAGLLVALGVRRWWVLAVVALAGSFGVFHVFYHWLAVPLPIGALGI
jgi:putative tricarboxylic transport membrane protein